MAKEIAKPSICCIFNHAPHYRDVIFTMMDNEFNCSFFIGNTVASPVKQMNYKKLKGYKKNFETKWILGTSFIWNYGVIRLIFKKFDYYLLIGEPSILSHWIILIFGKILGKKIFTWGHGIKCIEKKKMFWFEKLFYRLPYKIFVYGEHAKNNMLKLNYKNEKIIPIYNSLDYIEQNKINEKIKPSNLFLKLFKNDNPVIIYVGRILFSKKLNVLIEAFHKLINNHQLANLVIVGPEVDDDSIPDLVKKLDINENVLFYGPCYKEEVLGELFVNSMVSITPGNIGLSAIHSLTYGCPVITHNNIHKHGPEFEVIIDGKTGSFFIEDDIDDLVLKMKNWLSLDQNQRQKVKLLAKKTIDKKWNPFNQIEIFKTYFIK